MTTPERHDALIAHLDRAISAVEADPHGGKVMLRLDDVKALRALLPGRAATDVLAERQRQISEEGWTPEHDDTHDNGEMACAAASYALSAAGFPKQGVGLRFWPWISLWKPTTPRRDLVKAGALILAEIERLDRAKAKGGA